MNDFEKKLIADLASGKSADSLLAEFQTALAAAKKAEEERQKKIAAEKAEQERKKKLEAEREAKSKRIVLLANNALNNQTDADDVAWLFRHYVQHKYADKAEVLNEILTAKDVDEMISMATRLLDETSPLMKMLGLNWSDVVKNGKTAIYKPAPSVKSKKSDDEVISDFINKVLH